MVRDNECQGNKTKRTMVNSEDGIFTRKMERRLEYSTFAYYFILWIWILNKH